MNVDEWKEKQLKKRTSQYTHLDYHVSLQGCWSYISSPQKVIQHGFYPFIHYTIRSRKVKNGKKQKPKERQIYYAAHIDSWIYRYYSYHLNEAYNQRIEADGIGSVSVAYRTNLDKKCNIHFAKDAFNFIRKLDSCYVMIGDFTDFFDSLDHDYLKKRLYDLLQTERLPDDLYAVYKNITKYSYIELEDLLNLNGIKNTPKGRKEFNHSVKRALTPKQFRQYKSELLKHSSKPDRGVPQGSPISAVLANIYMLTADKKIQEYVSSQNGLYMRYSDDFIIILPKSDTAFSEQYKYFNHVFESIPNLDLEERKTNIYSLEDCKVKNCTSIFISGIPDGKDIIEFLGFSFDGMQIRIRDKTLSKYYNRMYRKIRTITKRGGFTSKNTRISKENLYMLYSYKGSQAYIKRMHRKKGIPYDRKQHLGNFLDYVAKANSRSGFNGQLTDNISRRHMFKIRKYLNKRPPNS